MILFVLVMKVGIDLEVIAYEIEDLVELLVVCDLSPLLVGVETAHEVFHNVCLDASSWFRDSLVHLQLVL